MTTTETELFNAAQYDVPFPEADGHKVTDLTIRIAGLTLNLNRHDPDHTALVEAFTLGQHGRAEVLYSVEAKSDTLKVDDSGGETVTHIVVLRLHSFDTQDG